MDAGNATRIVLRPLATPLPLGFLGLFVGTTMSSSLRLGWIPSADAHQVALALIVFTAPAQLIACIFGFLARDAVAATGMGLLFPAWLGLGVLLLATPAGQTSAATASSPCWLGSHSSSRPSSAPRRRWSPAWS